MWRVVRHSRSTAGAVEKIRKAEFVRAAHTAGQLLVHDGRHHVAFVGRSNVGKSSLLNRLLSRKGLARTSSTPGRTQSVNYFLIEGRFYFVDLPGYGYARASKTRRQGWASLMEQYFDRAFPEATVVLLVDGKISGTDLDREACEYLVSKGADPVVVATKIDKVPRSKRVRAIRAVRDQLGLTPESSVIEFSATTGEGLKALWREILSRVGTNATKEQVSHV